MTILRFLLEFFYYTSDLGFDVYTVVHYYLNGHVYWATMSLACVLMPGTLELLYAITELCKGGNKRESLKFALLFGPITFPISMVIWHMRNLCTRDMSRSTYSQMKVLESLHAFSESAPQLLLQIYILTIRYSAEWKAMHWAEGHLLVHVFTIMTSFLFLAKMYASHHAYELSGKTAVPSLVGRFQRLPPFLLSQVFRCALLWPLLLILGPFAVVVVASIVLLNFACARVFVGSTSVAKDIWTSFSSVLGLSVFMSRDDVQALRNSAKPAPARFAAYYLMNTISFVVVVSVSLVSIAAAVAASSDDFIGAYGCTTVFKLCDGTCEPDGGGGYKLSANSCTYAILLVPTLVVAGVHLLQVALQKKCCAASLWLSERDEGAEMQPL